MIIEDILLARIYFRTKDQKIKFTCWSRGHMKPMIGMSEKSAPYNDTHEALCPPCLTPASCIRERKLTNANTITAFQKANQEVFPEFPQQIDISDLASSTDETMSVTTNISEEEQQLLVFDAGEDDIFNEDINPFLFQDIAVAEEAFADEVALKSNKLPKDLKKQVNIMSVILSDMNVVASSLDNASRGAGYITKIEVQQSFNRGLNDIYAAMNSRESRSFVGNISPNNGKTTANFQFWSLSDGQPLSIKAQIEGFRATLDDIVLMHLSPFIYDDQKNDIPLNLKINLVDAEIIIKDSKTKPFQIKLNDCVIEQVVEDDAVS
uniref:Uncharacterized protein n=1 Tax=Setaria digitata TaxID=48799 RepID=A0A915PR92_9BILA